VLPCATLPAHLPPQRLLLTLLIRGVCTLRLVAVAVAIHFPDGNLDLLRDLGVSQLPVGPTLQIAGRALRIAADAPLPVLRPASAALSRHRHRRPPFLLAVLSR
jgi:hypothetical protein